MDFLILGPLGVHDGDRPVALGGARQRALLAMLLLNANTVVSTDRLVDELWAGESRADAGRALHVAISRLRKSLQPSRSAGDDEQLLITRPPGYELRLEPGQLDLHRFEAMVAEGRTALVAGDGARASATLTEALALWRGPPLADLAYENFCQPEIARLEELRLGAIEERVAADLARGLGAELVGDLQARVADQPLRERPRAQLMLALYRAGRQAEALEAYAEARRVLVEELGLEPSRELQELQRAVLGQDVTLDVRPSPRAVPSPRSFVGRDEQLARLRAVLDRAMSGHGGVALLAGEPGIGKSRLADELASEAQTRGARVLVGRCWEAGGAPAFWPWVQSLRGYIRDVEPALLREQLGDSAADLAQLLPELRELFADLPLPVAAGTEGDRFRLFDAVASFLARATRDRPILLLLDDVHAADEPSLLLLQYIAREIRDTRLLVICAFRDVAPTIQAPLAAALAQVMREPHTVQITLSGLSVDDVTELISLTGTTPAPGVVETIHGETDGNPLFVSELVRLLLADGRLAEREAHLGIPSGIRSVIGQRVSRLSDRCRDLLVRAAVLGREFELEALSRLSGMSSDEVIDVLDEGMTERVLGEVPGSPGRVRFAHALIRDVLYDEITPARRLRLHREAGEALEAIYAGDLEPHLAELVPHFVTAAPMIGPARAIDYARRAADRAATQLAYEEAARLYETALTLVDAGADRCELLLALGRARDRAGDTPASKEAFRAAAELAEAEGHAELLARAALGYGSGAIIWEVSRDDEYLVPLLERALARLGDLDPPLRVRLLARLAGGPLRDASFPPERKLTLSEEALDLARELDDPAALAYALECYILARHAPTYTLDQLKDGAELIEVATRVGDLERLFNGHDDRFSGLVEVGDLTAARIELATMERIAAELRRPSTDWVVRTELAMLALLEGRLGEAETLSSDAYELGERVMPWNAGVVHGLQLYTARWQQGRLAEIEELVRASVERYPTYRIWRAVFAHLAAALAHSSEARIALDGLAADDFGLLPFDETWLVSMCLLADTASALQARSRAAEVYGRLLPYGDRIAVSYPETSIGPVAHFLAVAAATVEHWDDAARHFEEAMKTSARIGAPSWLARSQHEYARVLIAGGKPADSARARSLAAEADRGYRALGLEPSALGALG